MCAGAVVIWMIVMGAAVAAVMNWIPNPTSRKANTLIIGGGVAFPTVTLAALLAFGLGLLPNWSDDPARLKVHVHGEQWWWRVEYDPPDDGPNVVSANELHLPAGQEVEIILTAAEVIHSFWVPSIGGKMDMIPGRTNRLLLEPTKPGIYRGVCAEYCGTSHARMAFAAVVHEPDDFDAWLNSVAAPVPEQPVPEGATLFLANGCAACHQVRGFVERGSVGPDLSHFGDRRTVGAGIVPNTQENRVRWIANAPAMKPAAKMPAYAMIPEHEIAAIAEWLGSLTLDAP